jgi:hypothetical protein
MSRLANPVFLKRFLLVVTLCSSFICVAHDPPPPHPFIDSVACEKELLCHRFWFYVRIYFYFIYLQYFVFWNILLMYNTLFTCTSNNIMLTIGFISSVFLGPDEQCNILNVRLQCGHWVTTQQQGGYVILTAIKSTNWNQIRSDKAWEKK